MARGLTWALGSRRLGSTAGTVVPLIASAGSDLWKPIATGIRFVSPAGVTARTYSLTTGGMQIITASQLLASLFQSQTFFYCQEVPVVDGWGNPMEYYQNTNLLAANVMAMRSPGRTSGFEDTVYNIGAFIATIYDNDIVWADGLFVRYPSGTQYVQGQQAQP